MRRAKTRTALLRPLRLAHWPQSTVLVVRPHLKDTEGANIVQNISDDLHVFLREINIEKIAVSVVLGFFKQLKGQCHEFFASGFFHESVSPQHQSIPVRPFRIFSKFLRDIRKSRCTTGINDTSGKFFYQQRQRKWWKNLTPVSMTPAANLPPVSTTPAANFSTIFASVVDTGGNINDSGSNLPPVSMTPAANFPPM